MVETIDAGGKDYRTVLSQRDRGSSAPLESRTYERVFYFDGDEASGELHIPHLSQALSLITAKHELNISTLRVDNTVDGKREAIVLSLRVDPVTIPGFPSPKRQDTPQAVLTVVKNDGVMPPEDDKYEGQRFNVRARRRTTNGFEGNFNFIIFDKENADEAAKLRVARIWGTHPSQIETTVVPLDREAFFREIKRAIDAGGDFSGDLVTYDSDPRIEEYAMKKKSGFKNSKKRKRGK